jgi:CubicO group peptidase (beta-lactamase class C family)
MTGDKSFEEVEKAFQNFVEADPTYSAQVTVHVRGDRVIDLVSGALAADSLVPVFSTSKGATAIVVAMLLQQGRLDLDAAVARYWPEFAANGKESITVRQLLSHQAGLPGVDGGFTIEESWEHDALAERLAAQRPYWRPGAACMYHALTIGTLADELVRRIDGRSVGVFFADEVARRRGIDAWLGLPASEDARVVDFLLPTAEELAAGPLPPSSPDPIVATSLPVGDPFALITRVNEEGSRRAGQPASGMLASARGLAAMYASLRHVVNGEPPVLDDATMAAMSQIQFAGLELGTDLPIRFGVLFQAPCPPRWPFGGVGAFGHDGAGGSLAFFDPGVDVAFGYTVQRLALPGGMDARAVELARLVRGAVTAR